MKRSHRTWTCWGVVKDDGQWPDHFYETFMTRARAIEYATQRCIGAHEYDRAGTDSKRWKIAYRRGWRLVRVRVTRLPVNSGNCWPGCAS